MRKARMNRTYRKRKDSDDDSANESRRRHRRKRKLEKYGKVSTSEIQETPEVKESDLLEANVPEDSVGLEKQNEAIENDKLDVGPSAIAAIEETDEPPEEGEVLEKEEGEIDSNEENYYSDSRSSSCSSRSYSSSPKRHRRHKRRSRRRKTHTPPIPKVPNWEASSNSALPKKLGKPIEENKVLPPTEDRQSVSFSLSKKSSSTVAPDSALQDDVKVKKPVIEIPPASKLPSEIVNTGTAGASARSESLNTLLKSEVSAAVTLEEINEVSCSEDEDGALPDNSDADMQDDTVIDPIKNMEVEDFSAPLEVESPDVSEALEEGTTSEVMAEDTSQDILEPCDEDDVVEEPIATDIIGVIDPMDDNASAAFNDVSNSSWSTRWLQSEKVQQVVSDSKMLSKVRKNIQAKGKTKVRKAPLKPAHPSVTDTKIQIPKVEVKSNKRAIGSTEDNDNMFGIKVKVPQSLPAPKSQKPAVETQVKAKSLAATLLDSDDEDDSEDDELWSKIMKK